MFRSRFHIVCLVAWLVLSGISSCTPVREAWTVTAQADSLLAEGQVYTDSLALAKAVGTMRPLRWVLPNDYARACFFYGRLLRIQEDYAEAMRYFICARHAHADDHPLLGRVYSNMAYICRMQGDYSLAGDIYAWSAAEFLDAGDTLRYYTACVNQAYTLAEQGDTAGVAQQLQPVGQSSYAPALAWMTSETRAEAYMRAGDYVQSLLYTDSIDVQTPSVLMIKGQCFSGLKRYDSAAYYARRVLEQTDHLFLQANALFILTQQDSTAGLPEVRTAAAQRAVVLMQIADNQGDLSCAVELLRQDIYTRPIKWGLLVISVLCLIVALLGWWWFVLNQHRHSVELIAQEKKRAQAFISAREQQNAELQQQLTERRLEIEQDVSRNIEALRQADDWRKSLCWNNYEQLCTVVNRHFYLLADKLKAAGQLNEKELRLCVLVLMDNFDSKQLATILHYGESGIRNFKQHTANKLGTSSRQLREHLLRMITGEA